MSPSRIPRPGGSAFGSPTITSSPLSQTTRPALGTLVHTSKNPFAQLHNKHTQAQAQAQSQPPGHGSPTPSNGSGNLNGQTNNKNQTLPSRRRPKPPSPDLDDGSVSGSPDHTRGTGGTGGPRRALPNGEIKPRLPSNPGPGPGPGMGHRSILRQPSTPALVSNRSSPITQSRPRALSSTTVSKPVIVHRNITPSQEIDISPNINTNTNGNSTGAGMRSLPSQKLFESSFLESREPPVPPHIRVRLRLIHQLGVVLGIDAIGISAKIDIPGLLARVDQAHDRGLSTATGANINATPSHGNEITSLKAQLSGNGHGQNRGVLGMFKRLGGGNMRKSDEIGSIGNTISPQEGPAFGVPLSEAPPGSWCTSLIGGQKHELPLVVFTVVEEIYRRGMSQPGIFRLAGDGIRISHLTKVFNLPPLYGDSLAINQEPIHNLTGLVKRYVRDLPEPILDESLFPAFLAFCVENDEDNLHDGTKIGDLSDSNNTTINESKEEEKNVSTSIMEDLTKLPLETRILAAQILLKLLPPLQFSLFIYLLAFLGQLPLFPDNRLNIESISIIFGPAMCAARGKGISGLGPTVSGQSSRKDGFDPDQVSDLVSKSQSVLGWLLRNWSGISEKVLEEDDSFSANPISAIHGFEDVAITEREKEKKMKKEKLIIDPRLLSPIDLRGSNDGMKARKPDSKTVATKNEDSPVRLSISRGSTPSSEPISPISPVIQTPHTHIQMGLRKSTSSHTLKTSHSSSALRSSPSSGTVGPGMKSSPSSGGLFARAFSSMSISSQAQGDVPSKGPKRSASFTSLSSLVKKVGKDGKHSHPMPTRSISDDRDSVHSSVNPQITTVLGSLHDLLVSKDKQIERDARELALLRHTLLEMDEKLQRATLSSPLPGPIGINGCICPSHPNATPSTVIVDKDGTPPEITITSTPSSSTLPTSNSGSIVNYNSLNKEISDLQSQLSTSLAGLENSRLNTRKQAERILVLEAKYSRAESEKKLEISKLQVALALEQARCVGLSEERDLARERLEKIKTTLFSVA
ncbi:uncharacterized protein IL334_004594 [Kwoniella shivajii]|uniref:Rho-GAP domain-containing protein n=1 Tax=Kwoniella shivajii TaxID=564305 RepID=A0ABZ1D209_9TREE|nr:hypothetical protein IL334_004594 [Kwoniella shivajii]